MLGATAVRRYRVHAVVHVHSRVVAARARSSIKSKRGVLSAPRRRASHNQYPRVVGRARMRVMLLYLVVAESRTAGRWCGHADPKAVVP